MAGRPNCAVGYPPNGRIYPHSAMSSQYIFTMYKLSRTHPPDKQVLKDISLSFMPGAKIGVLGLNGSGKSTLLRIMAGQDTEYRGEAQLAPGATVGLLEQEPHLDETKDVRGNVEEGVAESAGLSMWNQAVLFCELLPYPRVESGLPKAASTTCADWAQSWRRDTADFDPLPYASSQKRPSTPGGVESII